MSNSLAKVHPELAYLADGEKTEIGEDVMQAALLLQGMQNEELRKVDFRRMSSRILKK